MKRNRQIVLTLTTIAIGTLFCLLTPRFAHAQGDALVANAQLRRTVDPSPRAAFGSVSMKVANGRQTMQIKVRGLGDINFAPFYRFESSYTTNITPDVDFPPLQRVNVNRGNWTRTLSIVDFVPAFTNLSDLAGGELDISQPGVPDVTTIFTNIIGGVTNISMGVTNVVGNFTNVIDGIVIPNPGQTSEVFSVLWAPMYSLTTHPSSLSYHRQSTLTAIGQASPDATGKVKISFDGATGRSILKITARKLTKGQQYTLFVASDTNQDTTVMIPVDNLTQKNIGSTATFLRDTQFADPLPQQARDIGDLSGRIVQIRDAFDTVHLQGIMP